MADTTMQVASPASVWAVRARATLTVARRVPKIPTAVLLVLMIFATFGQWIAPHSPVAVDMGNSFSPPVWHEEGTANNLLGTDKLGRDIFSRLIRGARVSLSLSLFVIALGGGVGVALA